MRRELRAVAAFALLGLIVPTGAGCASGITPGQPDPGDNTELIETPPSTNGVLIPSPPAAGDDPLPADDPGTTPVSPPGGDDVDPPGGTTTPDAPPPPPPPPPQTSTQLVASCPGNVEVDRFENAQLIGGTSAGSASRFQWEVISRPEGSTAQPQPADAAQTQFQPDVDGDYLLRLTAFDSQGQSSGCDTRLRARFRGIRALVEWSPGDFTVELHMIDPLANAWFGGRDCFPGGCNVDWGVAGDALDNPSILLNLSGNDLFNFIEVPRVDAQAGDVYTVGLFVRAVLDGVVNNASGTLAVQCGENEPVAGNFSQLAEGLFLKGFDLVMRADGGCDVSLIGATVSEETARAAR